jgi:hypothetical protein
VAGQMESQQDEKLPYQTNEQKGDDFLNQFK